ncbi:unnamed protein product, partial [Staurois parvus]
MRRRYRGPLTDFFGAWQQQRGAPKLPNPMTKLGNPQQCEETLKWD